MMIKLSPYQNKTLKENGFTKVGSGKTMLTTPFERIIDEHTRFHIQWMSTMGGWRLTLTTTNEDLSIKMDLPVTKYITLSSLRDLPRMMIELRQK